MRTRVFIGTLIGVAALAVGVVAAGHDGGQRLQWSTMYLNRPTLIAGHAVMGPILLVHDEDQMEHGGPCTAIYRFDPATGRREKLVEFACKPVERDLVKQFTATCRPQGSLQLVTLTEYQFAGDTEAHGVPTVP